MHHLLRPEGDLTDWFIEGPMADMLSMAKEGLSREAGDVFTVLNSSPF